MNKRAASLGDSARGRTRDVVARGQGQFGLAAWACWAYIVVSVGRITEIFPPLSAVPLAKIAIALWLIGVMAGRTRHRSSPFPGGPLVRAAAWLVGIAIVSVLWSIWRGGSVEFLKGQGLVLTSSFVLVLLTARSWEFIRATLLCFVLCGLMLGGAALMLAENGRATIGTTYDPNDLAYILVTITPLCLALALTQKSRISKVLVLSCLAVLVLAVVLTQSRGGFVGLLAVLVYLAIPRPRGLEESENRPGFSRFVIRLIGFVLVGALVWAFLPEDATSRLSSIVNISSDYNLDSDNERGRVQIWQRNLAEVVYRPIGFGISTFNLVDFRTGGVYKAAHNSLVQIVVELGVLGLFFYLRAHWLAWSGLRIISKAQDPIGREDQRIWAWALCGALVGNFVSGLFLSMAYSNLIWLLLALTAATLRLGDASASRPLQGVGRRAPV